MSHLKEKVKNDICKAFQSLCSIGVPEETLARMHANHAIELLENQLPEWFESEKDVHTEHCCCIHGCKYRDNECTVFSELKEQSFACGQTSVCCDDI